jgi:hypothetical protein
MVEQDKLSSLADSNAVPGAPLADEAAGAFELAAAQLRASWDDLDGAEDAGSAELGVASPAESWPAHGAPLPAAPTQPAFVPAPKPSPFPATAPTPYRTTPSDEPEVLPARSGARAGAMKGWMVWGAAGGVALIALTWFALSGEPTPNPPTATTTPHESAAPAVVSAKARSPEPAPVSARPVPTAVPEAPSVQNQPPVVVAEEKPAAPVAVASAARLVPVEEPRSNQAAPVEPKRRRPARNTRPARTKIEPAVSRPAPVRSTREAAKTSKGTGFVSVNPY